MASIISPVQPSERITLKRLLWVGPLTIVAAIIANVIFQQSAVAILHPDPQFTGLTLVPAIVATFVGVLGAVVVYTLAGRFARRPNWLFRRIALVTLFVSFIPNILQMSLLGSAMGFTGSLLANIVALMVMHVIAWAISVEMLTQLTRPVA